MSVFNTNGSFQEIFQSVDPNRLFTTKNGSLTGFFGVSGFKNGKLSSLYLGQGTVITNNGYSLKSKTPGGSASLISEGKTIKISCNQETEIGLPDRGIKKAWLQKGSVQNEIKITPTVIGVLVTIPKVEDGMLMLE